MIRAAVWSGSGSISSSRLQTHLKRARLPYGGGLFFNQSNALATTM